MKFGDKDNQIVEGGNTCGRIKKLRYNDALFTYG
jgi:hypothetical protein